MIITSNGWISEKASFSTNAQGKIIREYSHRRLVITSTEGNTLDLCNELGYYAGMTFSNDPYAVLTRMEIGREEMSRAPNIKWDVDLTFSTEGTPSYANSIDPTAQRVIRSWQPQEQTLYIVRDKNSDLIVNSANQPYDGGIPVSVQLPTLTFEFNQGVFSGAQATAYSNALNLYTWSGAPAETLRLKIQATEVYEGSYHYWKTRYEMAYFPLGWQPQPINAGLYQLISGKLTRCKDRDKQDATTPMPLDANGKQIDVALLPDAAFVNKIEYYPTVDYNTFGLPSV